MKLENVTKTRSPSARPVTGSPERGRRIRRPSRLLAVLVAGGIAAGVALRVWVLASPMGALDGDEAIVGMMARHVLDGEPTAFFWGQAYGGSHEAIVTAAVFAVFGSGVLALKLTSVLWYAAAAVLVWRVGRRAVGERAAVLAALLFWIWPAFLVYWSTKSRGFYGSGLVLGLVVALLVLRLRERESRRDTIGLGLALGLGWWATPAIVLVALPFLAWLVWAHPGRARLAPWAAGSFLIGAAPWLVWNALNGWRSLSARPDVVETSYLDRLVDFFWIVLPTWLGLRTPFSLEWLPGAAIGIAAFGLVLAGLAFLLVRRPPGLGPFLLVAATFPFAYALSPYAAYTTEPRYLVVFAAVPAVLFGWLLARHRALSVAGIGLALAVSAAGLAKVERWGLYAPRAPDVAVPSDISPLLEVLYRERANRIRAAGDYWLVGRITFESDERLIASTSPVRYEPHERLVRAARHPAWVFLRGSRVDAERRPRLEAQGYRRIVHREFVVYVHPDRA